MREFVIIYSAALFFGLAVWFINADIVQAVLSGFALVGLIVFVWIISDEIKSRIMSRVERHYAKKYGEKK